MMNRNAWIILCLAYPIGLLSTGILGYPNFYPSWQSEIFLILGIGLLSGIAAIIIPRFWRTRLRSQIWLAAGFVAILAVVYFQLRVPQPGVNDISNILKYSNGKSQIVRVEGKILSEPSHTRNQRFKFWFAVQKLNKPYPKSVTGNLYVTIPPSQGKELHEGDEIRIIGKLYQPKSPSNPGSFNFKNYLAYRGTFAGLKGFKVYTNNQINQKKSWRFVQLRSRIVQAQVNVLGSPAGELVSSIVLGQKAVDLPYNIRDKFTKVGLAHILAASGFQISLLLGTILSLGKNIPSKIILIIGIIFILIYLFLTGFEPSVSRAAVMGILALIGLELGRKVIPLGSLLLGVTLLLLWQPLWVWDLGFQLSFLSTFGIIITLPALEKRLDWLPVKIATILATPLAASIWVLPLIIYVFYSFSFYTIPANILVSLLVEIISILGIISAAFALIIPPLGSLIALPLYYPTHLLIQIVNFFNQRLLVSLAVGKISLAVLLIIYGLICLIWLNQFWQRRWWLGGLLAVTLIAIPIIYQNLNLVQVTVLATKGEPVLVIQDRGKVTLINTGDSNTFKYTVLPFLNYQGINHINYGIDFASRGNQEEIWTELGKTLPIHQTFTNKTLPQQKLQNLPIGKPILVGSNSLELLSQEPPILQLKIQQQIWLLLGNQKPIPEPLKSNLTAQVLLWSGKNLNWEWLKAINPKTAITVSSYLEEETQQQLERQHIQLYLTGQDGAIQWTPEHDFQVISETADREASLM